MLFSRRSFRSALIPRTKRGPLRCLFVNTSLPVGGAETLLVNLIQRMNQDLVIPEVVCLKEPGPLGESIANEFKVHSHLIGHKYDVRVLLRLKRLFEHRAADAVITVGARDKMFWGRIAAHLAGVPVIAAALHSTGWPDGVGKLNRMLTPITDAFIGVANSHGEFLTRFEKFPRSRVHIVRNGVDSDKFRPDLKARCSVREELGLNATTPLVGIVAALREEKNHGMFVRLAAAIRQQHPTTHFVVVGDGPQRGLIESTATELGVTDHLHLLGTRSDTPRLVAALDCFALCSLNEASPVSILEALACGVPVVSTDVGSIRESILEGQTGYLVPSQDLAAMTVAVSRLLGDPDHASCLGRAGREHVLKTGSLDLMVAGYEELITNLYDARVHPSTAASTQAIRARVSVSPLRGFAGGSTEPMI